MKGNQISVVIATYNRAPMLRTAVEAALQQSRPAEEVIVSDDASGDQTAALLREMEAAHPRMRVFRRETNSGGVVNWNQAMERAGGEYIALCSDDDRFLPDHLEASAGYLDAHPEAGLVHSGFIDVRETGAEPRVEARPLRFGQPFRLERPELLRYLIRYYDWPVHPSTVVMRRATWQRVGRFNPAYQLTDTDWFARAVERSQAVYLPRYGVYNRRHAGNWSNRLGSARMQAEIFAIVEAAIERIYAGQPLARRCWRALWRANVRLRLAWTLAHRLRSGHREAAGALWHALLQATGRSCPAWMERAGERGIRWACAAGADPGPGVSPL